MCLCLCLFVTLSSYLRLHRGVSYSSVSLQAEVELFICLLTRSWAVKRSQHFSFLLLGCICVWLQCSSNVWWPAQMSKLFRFGASTWTDNRNQMLKLFITSFTQWPGCNDGPAIQFCVIQMLSSRLFLCLFVLLTSHLSCTKVPAVELLATVFSCCNFLFWFFETAMRKRIPFWHMISTETAFFHFCVKAPFKAR